MRRRLALAACILVGLLTGCGQNDAGSGAARADERGNDQGTRVPGKPRTRPSSKSQGGGMGTRDPDTTAPGDVDIPSDEPDADAPCPSVPQWECRDGESACRRISTFSPRRGPGYWNYAKNGESTNSNSRFYYYRSYARRDLVNLVKYAAVATLCMTKTWRTGIGGDLGLGDMSEKNGAVPGTKVGDPGHPAGSHVGGKDMDIAYFQKTSRDNKMRAVCPASNYHCTGTPNNLDVERTAVFLAKLHDSPDLRVIGVDGKIGPLVKSKIAQLCRNGLLEGAACRRLKLTYEVRDEGRGWFRHHHHHFHVSMKQVPSAPFVETSADEECIVEECGRN